MTEPTKIEFRYRRIRELQDVTDLVAMLIPGNPNQQHAAAQILLEMKTSDDPVQSLAHLEARHGISRRTLQRTRAKLARLGLTEHLTWMNSRAGGRTGWMLSSRMSTALRLLAQKLDHWRKETTEERMRKDQQLAELIR